VVGAMKLTSKQLEQIKKQFRLSPRETQIVELILQGVDSNEKLAENLGISLGVAKQYVHGVCVKFQISSKLGVAVKVFDSIQ